MIKTIKPICKLCKIKLLKAITILIEKYKIEIFKNGSKAYPIKEYEFYCPNCFSIEIQTNPEIFNDIKEIKYRDYNI